MVIAILERESSTLLHVLCCDKSCEPLCQIQKNSTIQTIEIDPSDFETCTGQTLVHKSSKFSAQQTLVLPPRTTFDFLAKSSPKCAIFTVFNFESLAVAMHCREEMCLHIAGVLVHCSASDEGKMLGDCLTHAPPIFKTVFYF